MTKDREPMPGEIRAVNYIVGEKNGQLLFSYRLEQYFPRRFNKGRWVPIRLYQEGENGTLTEILR